MDGLYIKQPKARGLIRLMFGLISAFVLTALVLIFVLKIHEVIKAPIGEIIAENVPKQYLAPFESEIQEIRITQGQQVSAGDTLMILYNPELLNQYDQLLRDIELEQENILIFEKLLKTLESKLTYQMRKEGNLQTELKYENKSSSLAIQSLKIKENNLKNKLSISRARLDKDFELLNEGVISVVEYGNKKKIYLEELNQLEELQKQLVQKQQEKSNLGNVADDKMNSQKLNFLSAEHEYYTTQKSIQEKKIRLQTLQRKQQINEREIQKQYVIADMDGHITWLFNTRQEASFVSKGTALIRITPKEKEKFYARLLIPEKDIKDIKPGQTAHLKLNAYNHYQYGVLKATVSFVNKDTSDYFFVLAELSNEPNNTIILKDGYKLKGEVIVGEMRLFRFIIKRLFTKMA